MNVLYLITALLLYGCASPQADLMEGHRQEFENYVRCNVISAKSIANKEGDPVSMAFAARAMCGQEDVALHEAIARNHSLDMTLRLMGSTRARTIERNAAVIVTVRGRRQ